MKNLELSHIRFAYNGKQVLDDVSLSVEQGEMVSLIGPNGAGKSTLIKLAMGFLKPKEGAVYIEGKPLSFWKVRELARKVAYLPQNSSLPPTFTVWETVLMGRTPYLGFLGIPGEEDQHITEEILKQVDITHLSHRRIGDISGGERQRAFLARALVQEPDCLLLDEPTNSLDIHHQVTILDLIRRLSVAKKLSVLAVLHDLNLSSTFTDRQVLLVDGKIIASGTPMEVMSQDCIRQIYGDNIMIIPHPRDKGETGGDPLQGRA